MLLVVAVLALTAAAVSSASAYTQTERSIYDWWTNVGGINNAWGSVFNLDDETDIWNQMTYDQYWTAPVSSTGWWRLEVEFAGHETGNEFGWYTPTLPGSGLTYNPIFTGGESDGSLDNQYFASSTTFGFYLNYTPGNATSPLYRFFSEDDRNGNDSGNGEDRSGGPSNAWGTTGYRHVRVFEDPIFDNAWILAWEDLPMPSPGYAASDYNYAWSTVDGDTNGVIDGADSLRWGGGGEPDYQDMIVRFTLVEENEPPWDTPELSTWLLMSLSLAAIPVLRRRRRA